jgi:HlyD family secretion protein
VIWKKAYGTFFAVGGVVALAAGAGVLRGVSTSAPKAIPTAHVQHGRVQVTVYTVGELRGARSMQLAVPPMGGQLQIVRLAETGDALKAGDVVVEFDASEQEFNLEQARFDLRLAEQDIVKADTQTAVQVADDEVALLHARYDVRRAELDLQSNELVSAIKAQQNELALDEAKQRLTQLEADVKTHRETSRASADGLREKRNKAQLSVQVAERNIDSLRVRAPFDGFITVRTNFNAFGGIGFPGVMPDFRVGDATFAGQPIADLIDASKVEVTAKLQEQDRANVTPGQTVEVAVDALPDATLRGTVRTVSGVASRGIFDAGTRQFDIAFDVAGNPAVRPGVSAAIAISGQTYDNVLYIPRTAVFDVSGKSTVYVRATGGFDAHEVRVRAWTDSVAVVENIEPSAEVALVNPNQPSGARPKASAPAPQRAAR